MNIMRRDEAKIIESINSQMAGGRRGFCGRLFSLTVFLGWSGLQNLYIGRPAVAFAHLALLLLPVSLGYSWLILAVLSVNYIAAAAYYCRVRRRRYY